MTEFFASECHDQPEVSAKERQTDILKRMFAQLESAEPRMRSARGPWYEQYVAHMQQTMNALATLGDHVTPVYLFGFSYQPQEVQNKIWSGDPEFRKKLREIQSSYFEALHAFADQTTTNVLANQVLPPTILNETPHFFQGEQWSSFLAELNCTSTAFRMVFEALAGWSPTEFDVALQLESYFGTIVVDDEVFLKLFATEAFMKASQKQVASIEIVGADFDYIKSLTQRIKAGRPQTEVYCMLTLCSQNGRGELEEDRWHKAVLLSADEQGVMCNDSSTYSGGNRLIYNHATFAKRWAITGNRARLVIATPSSS